MKRLVHCLVLIFCVVSAPCFAQFYGYVENFQGVDRYPPWVNLTSNDGVTVNNFSFTGQGAVFNAGEFADGGPAGFGDTALNGSGALNGGFAGFEIAFDSAVDLTTISNGRFNTGLAVDFRDLQNDGDVWTIRLDGPDFANSKSFTLTPNDTFWDEYSFDLEEDGTEAGSYDPTNVTAVVLVPVSDNGDFQFRLDNVRFTGNYDPISGIVENFDAYSPMSLSTVPGALPNPNNYDGSVSSFVFDDGSLTNAQMIDTGGGDIAASFTFSNIKGGISIDLGKPGSIADLSTFDRMEFELSVGEAGDTVRVFLEDVNSPTFGERCSVTPAVSTSLPTFSFSLAGDFSCGAQGLEKSLVHRITIMPVDDQGNGITITIDDIRFTSNEWRGFAGYMESPAAFAPRGLAAGDFTGDGIVDLVTANPNSNDVSVLQGNGNGTFLLLDSYTVGTEPRRVISGDFNGDGVLDLATANYESGNVSVMMGNGSAGKGDGTFGVPTNYDTGPLPEGIKSADLNNDNITDLVVANIGAQFASILLGNGEESTGDGTFREPIYLIGGGRAYTVAARDFNSDGITDLAIPLPYESAVTVFLGNGIDENGAPTFEIGNSYTTGSTPTSITANDFDNDGIVDLAISNFNLNNVSVILGNGSNGNGDGTFTAPVTYSAGISPTEIVSEDFNRDGFPDIAAANFGPNSVVLLPGNGSGGTGNETFGAEITFPVGSRPLDIVRADFNNDGKPDLAVPNSGSSSISVLMNLGVSGPDIYLARRAQDFGVVELGESNSIIIPGIQNAGELDLSLSAMLFDDGGGAFGLIQQPSSQLAPQEKTTLEVGFTPNTLGRVTGIVTINSNDSRKPAVTIKLSGIGIDTQEPSSSVTGPNGNITQGSSAFDIFFTAADNVSGSGIDSIALYYQRNGTGYQSYGNFTNSPISFDTTGRGGDGTYDFYTIATDFAGNTESKPPTSEATVIFDDTSNDGLIEFWTLY